MKTKGLVSTFLLPGNNTLGLDRRIRDLKIKIKGSVLSNEEKSRAMNSLGALIEFRNDIKRGLFDW